MPDIELRYLNEQAALPRSMIARAETSYTAAMRYIASEALSGGCRLILLAGPSGSGKTTSANLLADRIRHDGLPARVVSLDDFYRDPADPDYPLLKDGRQDYECVESLRISKIHDTIDAIQSGLDIAIPRFDFKEKRVIEDASLIRASDGEVIILEGLHALNPILTAGLPSRGVYRLFVSVSTNIFDGGKAVLSGKKLRFLRRLVRDSIFRSTPPERTISLWPEVLAGEETHLYPYKMTADFRLNTFHAYEPGVLAPRATALLEKIEGNTYVDIVKRALPRFTTLPEEYIPETSLIREFLSGGKYEDLY